MIPIIYKGGLPYIQHYYPTDKQMREITREEIMTSPGEWNPSLLDDEPDATQKRLWQFPPTPIEQTDAFYLESQIIVQKNDTDLDDASIVNDNSSTSSGSRRRSYRSRTRVEKQKKRHGPKGDRVKSIKWWDDKKSEDNSFPTHPPPIVNPVPDPVDKFDSRIRGVPIDIESELNSKIEHVPEVFVQGRLLIMHQCTEDGK